MNNLPMVATQWKSGATRESNRGPGVCIPSALTTRPLSRTRFVRCDYIGPDEYVPPGHVTSCGCPRPASAYWITKVPSATI